MMLRGENAAEQEEEEPEEEEEKAEERALTPHAGEPDVVEAVRRYAEHERGRAAKDYGQRLQLAVETLPPQELWKETPTDKDNLPRWHRPGGGEEEGGGGVNHVVDDEGVRALKDAFQEFCLRRYTDAKQLCEALDDNSNGRILAAEFKAALPQIGFKCGSRHARQLFAALDVLGNSFIGEAELDWIFRKRHAAAVEAAAKHAKNVTHLVVKSAITMEHTESWHRQQSGQQESFFVHVPDVNPTSFGVFQVFFDPFLTLTYELPAG